MGNVLSILILDGPELHSALLGAVGPLEGLREFYQRFSELYDGFYLKISRFHISQSLFRDILEFDPYRHSSFHNNFDELLILSIPNYFRAKLDVTVTKQIKWNKKRTGGSNNLDANRCGSSTTLTFKELEPVIFFKLRKLVLLIEWYAIDLVVGPWIDYYLKKIKHT